MNNEILDEVVISAAKAILAFKGITKLAFLVDGVYGFLTFDDMTNGHEDRVIYHHIIRFIASWVMSEENPSRLDPDFVVKSSDETMENNLEKAVLSLMEVLKQYCVKLPLPYEVKVRMWLALRYGVNRAELDECVEKVLSQ